MSNDAEHNRAALAAIIQTLGAMQLAQLTAFSLGLPSLYFCREYQQSTDAAIVENCQMRLLDLISKNTMTLSDLSHLLADREYFDESEARLRVAPLVD